MEKRKIFISCSIPEELERLRGFLEDEFQVIQLKFFDELLNHSNENSLLLFDPALLKSDNLSTLSSLLKKIKMPTILYMDSIKGNSYINILQEIDVSNIFFNNGSNHSFLPYTINKTINDFYHQTKLSHTVIHLKKKLGETENELRETKQQLEHNQHPEAKINLLEEIVFIFKRGKIELPSHPKLSIKFKNLMDKGASLPEIAELLKQDAAITSKLIAISNSPYYRGITNNSTLDQAIGRLGLNTTKQNVDVILNRSLYITKNSYFKDLIEDLWEHSLSTAYCSQIVTQHLKVKLEEDAFTLGLLHDIGKLVLIQTIEELRNANKLGENFDQSELLTTLKNYHGKFGASLLKLWEFSNDFRRIAAFHDNLPKSDTISKSLLIIHFSNRLVKSMGYGNAESENFDIEKEKSTKLLKLAPGDIPVILEKVRELMDEFKDFFN